MHRGRMPNATGCGFTGQDAMLTGARRDLGPDGYAAAMSPTSPAGEAPAGKRPILDAEVLAIGTELTTGETRDTNSGELAAVLGGSGVVVGRLQALPDDLGTVAGAFREALGRADLVVSTGGLGPTPDDLTREAIAEVTGEQPVVDADLEAWLRELWARRNMPFPDINLKQALLLPSTVAIPNANGTAPGWWLERPDGRVVVALPGPPREMRPMWSEWVLPRLRSRGLGRPVATRTLRLTGIGESQLADLLGDRLLRADNPSVATYARADAVDVRIAAVDVETGGGRPGIRAAELVASTEASIRELVGQHVWATGSTTWREAIGQRLTIAGWRLSIVEIGTGGSLTVLLADAPWLVYAVVRAADDSPPDGDDLEELAAAAREAGRCEVGIAVRTASRGEDTAVSVALVTPDGTHRERRLAFLGGSQGRSRAALTAAAILLARLPAEDPMASRDPSGAVGPVG
jgi:nicotinamide-nucleotide amidase